MSGPRGDHGHAVQCTLGDGVTIVGRHNYVITLCAMPLMLSALPLVNRATREPAFPTPVPGQEFSKRRRTDHRLPAWEESRYILLDYVGSYKVTPPPTAANLPRVPRR